MTCFLMIYPNRCRHQPSATELALGDQWQHDVLQTVAAWTGDHDIGYIMQRMSKKSIYACMLDLAVCQTSYTIKELYTCSVALNVGMKKLLKFRKPCYDADHALIQNLLDEHQDIIEEFYEKQGQS